MDHVKASPSQFDSVSSCIAKGIEARATLLFGGNHLEGANFNGGYFISPYDHLARNTN